MAIRFDRLLLAYPRWHRLRHGPDMLTTLSDCAADGRAVSARALVLDGIACRLWVSGTPARIAAACVSVIAAMSLAAGVSYVVWQAAIPPWPTVEQATSLARPVLPPRDPDETIRRDRVLFASDRSFMTPVLGSGALGLGGVQLIYRWPRDSAPGPRDVLAQARQRALEAGWQPVDHHYSGFAAHRDGMLVRVVSVPGLTSVSVTPEAPVVAYRLGWIGALAGALLGWMAAAATIARLRRATEETRSISQMCAFFGVVLSVPVAALNLVSLSMGHKMVEFDPPWTGYEFLLSRPAALAGAAALGVAWLVPVLREREHAATTVRHTNTVMFGTQA